MYDIVNSLPLTERGALSYVFNLPCSVSLTSRGLKGFVRSSRLLKD